MGAYINPKEITEEEWLKNYAEEVPNNASDFDSLLAEGKMKITLIDNGYFTAAAISFNKAEDNYFIKHEDERHKKYFIASIEELKKVSNLENYLD